MNLFFETSRQAVCFLWMIPLGLAAAFCLDISRCCGRFSAVTDIAVLLMTGFGILQIIVFTREADLRLYHLLGVMTGAILYLQGIGKIVRMVRRRQENRRRTSNCTRNTGKDDAACAERSISGG